MQNLLRKRLFDIVESPFPELSHGTVRLALEPSCQMLFRTL